MRKSQLIAYSIALLAGCGMTYNGVDEAPTISDIRILTQMPARGAPIKGDIIIGDGYGLSGAAIALDIKGPIETTLEVDLTDAGPQTKTAVVPFEFKLETTDPAGVYTITATAHHPGGQDSVPVKLTVQIY